MSEEEPTKAETPAGGPRGNGGPMPGLVGKELYPLSHVVHVDA